MIDKKELRYGNLLKHGNSIVTVEEIGDDGINICWMHEMTGWDYDYKNLDPIELNSDWLDKLGFKKKEESQFENIKMKHWVHEAVCLFYNDGDDKSYYIGYGFNTFEGKYYCSTMRWINHLHTLQNIFHSLTGKELELKQTI